MLFLDIKKMKDIKHIVLMFIASMALFAACDLTTPEDEEPANVYARISGEWTIYNMNMLAADIPGDGSTLTFDYCDEPPCTGKDYKASDGTTGTFTYEFSEDEQKIFLTDDDPNGGNYNTTWNVLELEKSKLRMVGDFSIFGSMLLEMSK